MIQLSEKDRTPRDWDEAFEDIVDDPKQNPIVFYEEEDAYDLVPAIAEGPTLRDAIERYQEYRRQRDEREQYE
jgi:hypothetical protein